MAFIIRVMALDTHEELVRAWRAINAAPESRRASALAELQDLSVVTYERAGRDIKAALNSKNKVDEIALARTLAQSFRNHYKRAEMLARGTE
jgi:iron(III) transport system substrate-binding protein